MNNLKFVVRWVDREGRDQTKIYPSEKEARKARDWLLDNGAKNADYAIRIKNKDHAGGMFPSSEDTEADQPSLL